MASLGGPVKGHGFHRPQGTLRCGVQLVALAGLTRGDEAKAPIVDDPGPILVPLRTELVLHLGDQWFPLFSRDVAEKALGKHPQPVSESCPSTVEWGGTIEQTCTADGQAVSL